MGINRSLSGHAGFKIKQTLLAVLFALQAGCDGSAVVPQAEDLEVGQALELPDNIPVATSQLQTGVFLDSPVANINFHTASRSGKTNEKGEYLYLEGEEITFTIGNITLPAVIAQEAITPLDIFKTTDVKRTEVINLSRLLQTLDSDRNPENGIDLHPESDDLVTSSVFSFQSDTSFQAGLVDGLANAGIPATVVDSGTAVTHLANSLLTRGMIEAHEIDSSIVVDESQPFAPLLDLDTDGVADVFDSDDDGDEVADEVDHFPHNAAEQLDTDADGIGNNSDDDDDNDGVADLSDSFPLDPTEQFDTDQDGMGDRSDNDDDSDNVPDDLDAFPLLATESRDLDRDGIGDNADPDDDNDGVIDVEDSFPDDPSEQIDTDGDEIGNDADQDDDNDGTPDYIDAFPTDPAEQLDSDNDGIGNSADRDDDNDGTPDFEDILPLKNLGGQILTKHIPILCLA